MIFLNIIFGIQFVQSQDISFEWTELNSSSYSNNEINICGESKRVKLKVSWKNDPNCPYSGWGANRYRWTTRLYKNNILISTRASQSGSCWINEIYNDFQVSKGVYRAHITLEVRGWLWVWQTQRSGSAGFNVNRNDAVPSFTINGIIPNPEIPIEVCSSKININPSGTTCEGKYYVGVWEFDFLNWDRPNNYEWGRWFDGEAPAELNLQQLSAQHSQGANFSGDLNRQGEVLYGGNLSNNNLRYYYISICTGYPEWKCESAVIKVSCSCP